MKQVLTTQVVVTNNPSLIPVLDERRFILRFGTASLPISDGVGGNSINYYDVIASGRLAKNGYESIKKGDRILLTGALTLIHENTADGRVLIAVIKARTMGHDLTFGTSNFTRYISAPTLDGSVEDQDEIGGQK
jgi:single-stranded DNA-binding protein